MRRRAREVQIVADLGVILHVYPANENPIAIRINNPTKFTKNYGKQDESSTASFLVRGEIFRGRVSGVFGWHLRVQ
jgi:hypothetical protein